jgi:hypothetical protein
VFVVERFDVAIKEILIYFAIEIPSTPAVKICPYELVGYEWVDLRDSLKTVTPVTTPTGRLFNILEEVDFWADFEPVPL